MIQKVPNNREDASSRPPMISDSKMIAFHDSGIPAVTAGATVAETMARRMMRANVIAPITNQNALDASRFLMVSLLSSQCSLYMIPCQGLLDAACAIHALIENANPVKAKNANNGVKRRQKGRLCKLAVLCDLSFALGSGPWIHELDYLIRCHLDYLSTLWEFREHSRDTLWSRYDTITLIVRRI